MTLLFGLVFGAIGSAYILYGGRQHEAWFFVIGFVLILYPYFIANAFLTLDLNTIVGGTMLVAFTFCVVNLLVDLLYAFLNPKITYAAS